MNAFELTLAKLEARDIRSDCATMGTRIEAYRTHMPSEHPVLVVNAEPADSARATRHVPEISAEELTIDQLRAAISSHGALLVRNLLSKTSVDTLNPAVQHMRKRGESHCGALVATLGVQRGIHGKTTDQGNGVLFLVWRERSGHTDHCTCSGL